MPTKPVTHAIRYTGPGWDNGVIMYVTEMDLGKDVPHRTGYGYCCGCSETLKFASPDAAEKYMERNSIPKVTHTIIDSVTAAKEKAARKGEAPPCQTKPKSAVTGLRIAA